MGADMGSVSEVRVRVPGSSANLGPGLRLARARAGLYDDVEVSVAPDGVAVEVRRRGRRPGAVRRRAPRGPGHAHAPGTSSATPRRASGCAAATPSRTPAGWAARPPPRWPARWPRSCSPAATWSWSATRCCRSPRVWRATPTTRRPACSAASSWPGRRASGIFAERFHAVRLDAHPDIRPVALVAGTESLDQHHARAAARPGAAGRRGLHRQPHRARGAGLHPAPRAAAAGHRGPAAPGLPAPGLPGVGRAGRRAACAGRAGGHLRRRADRARADHRRRPARRARPARLHPAAAAGRHRGRPVESDSRR